jgi:hypothetical protein
MQHTWIVATHLRGRAALAAALDAQGAVRAARLELARRCAVRLERYGSGWGGALAALLHAGVSRALGQTERGAEWLRRGIEQAALHELALFKAAAEMGAAQAGGPSAPEASGERWMSDNGVRAPGSLARMLVPGLMPPR